MIAQYARDGDDRPIRLRVTFLGDARTRDRLAVAAEDLAVRGFCYIEVIVPGFRRLLAELLKNVRAVVDHLEVAIERDEIGLAVVLLREVDEERHHVVFLQCLVIRDTLREVFEEGAFRVIDHPLRREDRRIDRIRARGPIRQKLLIKIRERHRQHVHLRTRQLLELGRAALQRLGDLRTDERHHVDGHALEVLGRHCR